MTTSMIGTCNQIESSHAVQSQAHHTFVQAGQKTIIQAVTAPAYVIQQHKISPAVPSTALKAISSTLAVEQSLTSNLVVRTISQNDSPPLTLISTPKKNLFNSSSSDNFSTENKSFYSNDQIKS